MARAMLKYVFAALLALLYAQAFVPTPRTTAAIVIVWESEAEQQAPCDARPVRAPRRHAPPAIPYVSRFAPGPNIPALFQRPPPAVLFFS